jgi:hypothetical protein
MAHAEAAGVIASARFVLIHPTTLLKSSGEEAAKVLKAGCERISG